MQPPHHHHHHALHHHPSHYGGLIPDPSPPAQPVSEQAIKKRKKNLNGLVRSSIMLPNAVVLCYAQFLLSYYALLCK